MRVWPSDEKVIVVDTEEYSGNFERQMVAYITGLLGECGMGEKLAALAKKELPLPVLEWFEEHVVMTSDEHGVHRPASISPTPGWYNDGRGNHYRDTKKGRNLYKNKKHPAYQSVEFVVYEWPPDHIVQFILDRTKYYCEHAPEVDNLVREPLTLTGVRFVRRAVATLPFKRFQPPHDDVGWLSTNE